MLTNLVLACLLMIITTATHAGGMLLTILMFRSARRGLLQAIHQPWLQLSLVVLLMFSITLLEAWIWAAAYLWLGAIVSAEAALYFSLVTYTTLGYGDVVLHDQWRLLAALQAGVGILMFGWTTGIVIQAVKRIYHIDPSQPEQPKR